MTTAPARPDLDAIKRREAEMDGHKIGNPAEWCRTCALVAWVEALEGALHIAHFTLEKLPANYPETEPSEARKHAVWILNALLPSPAPR